MLIISRLIFAFHLFLLPMPVSVIISYYKNIPALELVLMGLSRQSMLPNEVIIAEDDNENKTAEFIKQAKGIYPFKILHLNQHENLGFRKNQMLNKAVTSSSNSILAFLDGDCIPHRHWLMQCLKHVKPKQPVFGRRVMTSPSLTKSIYKDKDLKKLNLLQLALSGSSRLKYGLYLPFTSVEKRSGMWGCNWAVYKEDLMAINGFDEQYIRAGIGEDVDVEWRLNQAGIFFNSVRQHALVFHMHHESHYSDADVNFNKNILDRKKALV
jgi:cellulose synthase/poly-beta-1,6-N-acetylglucosamine synthase-like glycosyltransferase